MSLCESNCEYKGYDTLNKIAECECNIKNVKEIFSDQSQLLNEFKSVKKIMNLDLVKCYKTDFSKECLKSNIGFYLILCFIVISIICSIYFLAKGYDSFITSIYTLIRLSVKEIKEDKDNTKKSENINKPNNSNIKKINQEIYLFN